MSERIVSQVIGIVSLTLGLLIWEAASRFGLISPIIAPAPSLIAVSLWNILRSGEFVMPLMYTLGLFASGYTIACTIGIGLGVLMGYSRTVYGLFEPLVELIRPIPKPALVPALFLFLGIGPLTMVTIVVLATVFPVLINTLQGVRALDPILLDTAATFHCSRRRTIFQVIIPSTMPMILSGMRVGLGIGLVLVILAEMLAGENGLGFLILDLQRSFRIREMYAWIAILAALGGGLTLLFDAVDRRAVPWRGQN